MPDLHSILADPSASWSRRQPASEAAILALSAACDFALPNEYLTFLRYSNGGEGALCIEPGYFQIRPAEEVAAYNAGYKVEEFLPGYLAIGSNGAGEMLAIRKRDGSPCPVYMVPFCPMAESDVVEIAFDFEMFAMAIGHELL
jgi:hypothetical protein